MRVSIKERNPAGAHLQCTAVFIIVLHRDNFSQRLDPQCGYYPDFIRSDLNQGWLLKMSITLRISADGRITSQVVRLGFIYCNYFQKVVIRIIA